MTRKHFIAIADSLGLEIRHADNAHVEYGIRKAIDAMIPVFKGANSMFDEDRFINHINEVAVGAKSVTS